MRRLDGRIDGEHDTPGGAVSFEQRLNSPQELTRAWVAILECDPFEMGCQVEGLVGTAVEHRPRQAVVPRVSIGRGAAEPSDVQTDAEDRPRPRCSLAGRDMRSARWRGREWRRCWVNGSRRRRNGWWGRRDRGRDGAADGEQFYTDTLTAMRFPPQSVRVAGQRKRRRGLRVPALGGAGEDADTEPGDVESDRRRPGQEVCEGTVRVPELVVADSVRRIDGDGGWGRVHLVDSFVLRCQVIGIVVAPRAVRSSSCLAPQGERGGWEQSVAEGPQRAPAVVQGRTSYYQAPRMIA